MLFPALVVVVVVVGEGGGGRTMLFPAFSKTAVEIFFLWGRGGHLHLLSHPPPPPPLRRHPAIE